MLINILKTMFQVSELGFGTIETRTHALNKTASSCFRKRKYEDLSDGCKDIAKKLKIDEDKYMNGSKGKIEKLLHHYKL